MDVYGLTGGIGSGKSSVARLLEDFGVPVVSADELSRVVVTAGSEGLGEVVRAFGSDVLDERGELDRRKMAAIVFREPARRQQLESILHPRIRERFEQVLDALEKAGHPVAVYEVPLLFEKNLQSDMKATILVTATEQTRIGRVMERDQVTETEVRDRIASQMPESLKRKRADYIIENDGSVDDLRREVRFLLERFLRLDARLADGPPYLDSGVSNPSTTPTQVPGASIPTAGPGRTRTEIPTQPPSSVSTQPPVPPATPARESAMPPAPPAAAPPAATVPPPAAPAAPAATVPPPAATVPAPAPPPPPGLHVPTPTPAPAVPQPSTHRTEPALPAVPVAPDEEG